jgi:hypothetical protein
MSINAFKPAKSVENGSWVIIQFTIPEDAIHNVERPGVIDANYADHRANKVTVAKIHGVDTTNFTLTDTTCQTAVNYLGGSRNYYKVGSDFIEPRFNPDLSVVQTSGIHFYSSVEGAMAVIRQDFPESLPYVHYSESGVAVYTETPDNVIIEKCPVTGLITCTRPKECLDYTVKGYYSNGSERFETTYVNGLVTRSVSYYPTGTPNEIHNYSDGSSTHEFFYESGSVRMQYTKNSGEIDGEVLYFAENGDIILRAYYAYGDLISATQMKSSGQSSFQQKIPQPAEEHPEPEPEQSGEYYEESCDNCDNCEYCDNCNNCETSQQEGGAAEPVDNQQPVEQASLLQTLMNKINELSVQLAQLQKSKTE